MNNIVEFGWEGVMNALEECRQLARRFLNRQSQNYSWRPTSLMVEALRRLHEKEGQWQEQKWQNDGHFFAAYRKAMKSAIVDRHRRAMSVKRPDLVPIEEFMETLRTSNPCLITNYEMWSTLQQITGLIGQNEPLLAELIELRFIFGLSLEEIGQQTGYSERQTRRHWAKAMQQMEAVIQSQ